MRVYNTLYIEYTLFTHIHIRIHYTVKHAYYMHQRLSDVRRKTRNVNISMNVNN